MTKAQILQEMQQMEAYLKERKLNLPEVIFLSDNSVHTANKRLKELQTELDKQMALTEEQQRIEQESIDKSTALLNGILDEVREIIVSLDDKSMKLHSIHRGRFLEVSKSLKQLLR